MPSPLWWSRISMMSVLLTVFLTQAFYITHIQRNKTTVDQNCSQQHKWSMVLLAIFAVVQVGSGVFVFTM